MSLNRPIASYEDNMSDYVKECIAKSCDESKYIGQRSTEIIGNTCRWLTNKGRTVDRMHEFNSRHTDMSVCQCEGHYMMRIHSVALVSFLAVLNIDPETNI